MDAEFFDEASGVINSPYFYEKPDTQDRRAYVKFIEKRDAEKSLLVDALNTADTYNDLKGDPKAIYDRARVSFREAEKEDPSEDRLSNEPMDLVVSEKVEKKRGPSQDNSVLLAAAITDAMAKGDRETADKLAELAKDPDRLQAMIDAAVADMPYEEQAEFEEAETGNTKAPDSTGKNKPSTNGVKPSPFKKGGKSLPFEVKDQGQPCKQGEAASRTGCIPSSGEAGKQSSPDKTARTFQEKVKVSNVPRMTVEQLANGNSLVIQQGSIVKDGVKMPVYRWAETQGGKTAVNAGPWTNQLMYARRGAEQHSKDSKKTTAQSQQSSEVKKKLSTAPVANATDLMATYNTVLLITFEDGTEAVFKPGSGELGDEDNRPLRSAVPTGKMYLREVAASSVADVLGFSDLVPATVLREEQGEAGSAQEYVTDARTAVATRADDKNIYDGPDLIRAAVFDYLMCNQDRHMGNWMVKNDGGGISLIDNGLSLPTAYDGDDFLSGNLRFFNEADRQNLTLPDLSSWEGKWPEVEKSLAGIEPEAVVLCKQRFEYLVKASKDHAKFMDLPGLMPGKQTLRDWTWVFGKKK